MAGQWVRGSGFGLSRLVRGRRIPGRGFSGPGSLGEWGLPGGATSGGAPARGLGERKIRSKKGPGWGGVGVLRLSERKVLEDRKKRVG